MQPATAENVNLPAAPESEYDGQTENQEEADDASKQAMPAPFMNLEADEETEIKKKIALYYHPLFHSTLAQWFLLL